jgi:hypothetical protein
MTVGEDNDVTTIEYYGFINDIIELNFQGYKSLSLVLFDCHWFHPRNGVRRMPLYGLVEVAQQTVNPGFEPFVVAQQATHVYYIPYPCKSVRTKFFQEDGL